MNKLVIIGVGGFGREVAWLVERINKIEPTWDLVGFVDDNKSLHDTNVGKYKVLGDCEWLNSQEGTYYAVCAIGAAKVRKKVINKLQNIKFATLIDPTAEMSERIEIGEGTIVCAHSILTVDISLGSHVIINLDCTVGHDAVINNFVTLYPSVNVSGNTALEDCVEVGTGTQIIQGLKITEGTIIGAGAVVAKNIEKTGIYVGIPARKMN